MVTEARQKLEAHNDYYNQKFPEHKASAGSMSCDKYVVAWQNHSSELKILLPSTISSLVIEEEGSQKAI